MDLEKILSEHLSWLSGHGGKRAYFRDANLRNADFHGADLRGAVLQYANLRNANLRNVNLQNTNLQGANLQDADLRNANLHYANMQGTNLQYAKLCSAKLWNADLQDADLRNANLQNADLWGAKLPFTLMLVSDLRDAIDLAPLIFRTWKWQSFEAARDKFSMYQIEGEGRALVLMCPDFSGGYCYVLYRKEIWWWSWSCPDPETVPILWRQRRK